VISVRPATAADVTALHGCGASYIAWACDLDGEPVGAIGLALTRPRACLFCGFDEKLRPYLKAMPILRLLKRVEALIRERGLPVYAIRQPDEPKAEAILTRLGFEYFDEIDGDQIFEWNPA
jgi:hypothetical protein